MDDGKGGRGGVGAVLLAPVAGRTWREFAYLLVGLPLSILYFSLAITGVSLGAGLLVTFLGVPVLAGTLAMSRGIGRLERARVRALLGRDVIEPAPIRAKKSGPLAAMGAVLKSGSAWRHLLYCLVHFPWAVFGSCTALTFWAAGWTYLLYPLWFWVFPAYTDQPGLQLFQNGDYSFYVDSPAEIALTCLIGLALTLATPWLIRALTTVDRVLVGGLLGASRMDSRVTELESDRGSSWTPPPPTCGASNGICTTARRPGWWRWRWTWGWRRRSSARTRGPPPAWWTRRTAR